MATIKSLQREYESLTTELCVEPESAIDSNCLIVFDYEYQEHASIIDIDRNHSYPQTLRKFFHKRSLPNTSEYTRVWSLKNSDKTYK